MGVTFEHDRIRMALVNAGVVISCLEKDFVEEQETLPIFLSWSSRESLLRVPEYAWLSLRDVNYVRLPQRLADLLKQLELSTRPWSADPEMKLLKTPLGQWLWAVRNLQDSFGSDNRNEIPFRLSALRRFAARNWAGWFEKTLNALRVRAHSSSLLPEDVEVLIQQAPAVAVFEACRPLLGWSQHEVKGRRAAIFEDALSYLEQGVAEISHVITLAAEDPWWDDMGADLDKAERHVLQARQGGASVDKVFEDGLTIVRDCIGRIRQLKDFTEATEPAKTHETKAAIQMLMQTIGEIRKLQSRAFEHANASR